MTILIALNNSDITYNDITCNCFYLQMALLITVKLITLINVKCKVIVSKVFMRIVVGPCDRDKRILKNKGFYN